MSLLAEKILFVSRSAGDAPMVATWDSPAAATWQSVADAAERLSTMLADFGLPAETPIGLVVRNDVETVIALLAILGAGRCVVYFNGLQPAERLLAEIAQIHPAALLYGAGQSDRGLIDTLASFGGAGLTVTTDGQVQARVDFRSDRASGLHAVPQGSMIEIQTSGTTGAPKRIALPGELVLQSLIEGTRGSQGLASISVKRSPTFLFSPLAHAGGTFALLHSVLEARPVLIFDKFRLDAFRAALGKHQPRFLSLPPPMLRMVLDSDITREEMASVIAIRCGTAPLDPKTQQCFEDRFGIPVLVTYGATEFMGALARWTLEDHRRFSASKRGSVGRPSPDIQMRVIDEERGVVLPADQEGILEVRGTRTGSADWQRTTDLARIDGDGFLFIVGRADDAIIRGGFKVMSGQVAAVLERHPAVHEASVIGIPDRRLGEVPVAAVVLKPGAEATPADIEAFARDHLTGYQIPARILIVSKLPRTVSLKVSRPGVRELFSDEQVEGAILRKE